MKWHSDLFSFIMAVAFVSIIMYGAYLWAIGAW